jgi:hypothetical protein
MMLEKKIFGNRRPQPAPTTFYTCRLQIFLDNLKSKMR